MPTRQTIKHQEARPDLHSPHSLGMAVSEASLSRRDQKIVRLYEQGASKERVGAYLRRWLGWAVVASLMIAGCSGFERVRDDWEREKIGIIIVESMVGIKLVGGYLPEWCGDIRWTWFPRDGKNDRDVLVEIGAYEKWVETEYVCYMDYGLSGGRVTKEYCKGAGGRVGAVEHRREEWKTKKRNSCI